MKDQQFLEALEDIEPVVNLLNEKAGSLLEDVLATDKALKYAVSLLSEKADAAYKLSMFSTTTIRDTALETGKSMAYKDAAQILRNMHSLCSQLPPPCGEKTGA